MSEVPDRLTAALGRLAEVTMGGAASRPELHPDDVALLRLMSEGLPAEAVARRLQLSDRTVRRRTRSICDRLGVSSPIQAIVWAARRGLL